MYISLSKIFTFTKSKHQVYDQSVTPRYRLRTIDPALRGTQQSRLVYTNRTFRHGLYGYIGTWQYPVHHTIPMGL